MNSKKHEEIPIVSVNASKKDYLETIEKYNLKYTPTYVLVDKHGDKIYKGSVLLMLRSLTLWLVKKLCHLNQLLDWVEAVKHPIIVDRSKN